MNRPAKDKPRATIYLVTTAGHAAGRYVGETATHVVLNMGETVRGFLWKDVESVEFHETDAPPQ